MTALLVALHYVDWLVRAVDSAVADERAALYRARLATVVTIPVTVVRHQCPHCTRRWARKQVAKNHVARCWNNPDVQACAC